MQVVEICIHGEINIDNTLSVLTPHQFPPDVTLPQHHRGVDMIVVSSVLYHHHGGRHDDGVLRPLRLRTVYGQLDGPLVILRSVAGLTDVGSR